MLLLSKRLLVLAVIISSSVVVWMCSSILNGENTKFSAHVNPRSKFIVDTPGCKILDADPYDDTIRHLVELLDPIKCNATPALTYIENRMLHVNWSVLQEYYAERKLRQCEYQAILRPDVKSDNVFKYGEAVVVSDGDLIHDEFLRITCSDEKGIMMYTNFHTVVQDRRREILHQEEEGKSNVILIGVDSISRLNFIRQMPKTRKFLLDVLGAVEFSGYNKVDDNTFVNLAPMLAGKFVKELPWDEFSDEPLDGVNFIWKNFSQHGYRTLFAEDAPNIAIFNYDKPGFHHPPTDHYLRPFSLALEDHRSMWRNNHDCVGPMLETDVVLNYVKQFVDYTNGGDPLWAFAFITRLTHDNIHKASLADDSYHKFFQDLHESGHLVNSLLIFFSDHGMRFGEIRETFIGKLEERLPFLYIALPPSLRLKYPSMLQNLIINSNRLTTPFDIHETLAAVLNLEQECFHQNHISSRGMNLFAEVPMDRTCKDAAIGPHWCTCYEQQIMDTNSSEIFHAAQHIVHFINHEIRVHSGKCSPLTLVGVTDARIASADRRTPNSKQYLLTIKTQPGSAVFEATVFANHTLDGVHQYEISGDISRINQYGDQSMCIEYHGHKKFCFCV